MNAYSYSVVYVLFMQHPICPGFSFEDKRWTGSCFIKPEPKEKHKWKERKWDVKILTELEIGHILLTQEAFGSIFSSGNVVEAGISACKCFLNGVSLITFETWPKEHP